MRIIDPFSNPLLAEATHCFGGGKTPTPPKQEKLTIPEPPAVTIPDAPPPAPPPAPTPSQSKLEVQEAAAQQRKDAKRRQGMAKSLIAGETGGYTSSATGTGSLLG